MSTDRMEHDLPQDCREHRARGAGWERGSATDHARNCDACRRHDFAVAFQAAELRSLQDAPVRDLWPAIVARTRPLRRATSGPAWFARCAAALVGLASVTVGLCALERAREPHDARRADASHAAFAALAARPDHVLLASAPEIQLLSQLATQPEGGR